MSRFTILMATYNRAGPLAETLGRFAALEPVAGGHELVVIDNNSADQTAEVLARFARRLPMRSLSQPVPGKTHAMNLALDTIRCGEFTVFVDDDISPEPGWLRAIARACERWPEHSVFGGRIDIVWPQAPPAWAQDAFIQSFAYGRHAPYDEEREYLAPAVPFGANYWVRSAALEHARFDGWVGPRPHMRILGDETIFVRRLCRDGRAAVYVPDAAVGHRIEPSMLRTRAVLARAYRMGRTAAYFQGLADEDLLARSRAAWIGRHAARLSVAAGGLAAVALLSGPTRRVPRMVSRMLRMGRESESLRAVCRHEEDVCRRLGRLRDPSSEKPAG